MACANSTLTNRKRTETDQGNGAAFFERLLDCINDGFKCAGTGLVSQVICLCLAFEFSIKVLMRAKQ